MLFTPEDGLLYSIEGLILFKNHQREVAQEELNAADQEKIAGIAILSFISLVTISFYFFVKNALSVIRYVVVSHWSS